eukprot:5358920-Pleurochrysis_carterae.AAC.1
MRCSERATRDAQTLGTSARTALWSVVGGESAWLRRGGGGRGGEDGGEHGGDGGGHSAGLSCGSAHGACAALTGGPDVTAVAYGVGESVSGMLSQGHALLDSASW